MTLTKKQQDLEKGCGKPVLNLNGDVTICCGDSMDDKIDESGKEWFLKYICPECKAELQGITFAKEEILKEIEKFLLQQDSLIYNFLAQRLSEDEFCDLRNQSIKELKEKIK